MAASDTYIIKTVTFKGTAITGLQDVQFGNEADVVSHNSDGQVTVAAVFLDNLKGSCRVSSTNTGLASTANFAMGATGSLVMTFQKRAAGKGAVAGQDKVLTAAAAFVIRNSGNGPHADRGSFDLEFECVDSAGVDPFAWT